MSQIPSESERVGLCYSCQHVRLVRTDRGSIFYQCQRSVTDPTVFQIPSPPGPSMPRI